MLFSQVFTSRSFTGALLYRRAVGWRNTEIEFAVAKQTKNGQFCFFQNILLVAKEYFKTGPLPTSKMELAVTITNGSPTYTKSTLLTRRLPDLSSTTHVIL